MDPGKIIPERPAAMVAEPGAMIKRNADCGATTAQWTVAETDQSIPARFEQQVCLHSSKIAIDGTSWRPTYSELNAVANRHAHALLAGNGIKGSRIALILRHDGSLIAAVLGILKAGRVVVVLNPEDAPSHVERLRLDAEPELVIIDDQHRDLALQAGFPRERIFRFGEEARGFPDTNPCSPIHSRDAAVLIQTSGSTGEPRSVIQTHRNVLHNTLRISNGLGLLAKDRVALIAATSGGLGVATTWISLLNGATLCPFPTMETGFNGLPAWLVEQRITIYTSAASVFRHFVRTLNKDDRFPDIRLVRLASEQVLPSDFRAFQRHFAVTSIFANAFACSEAGNITQHVLDGNSVLREDRIPVGKPSEGIKVVLLDENGTEVPKGQTGEIVVHGEYLSPGYWKNEKLTAQHFTSEGATGNVRSFRSGDLGQFGEDGSLTVVGRKATRAKVRGYWVEPSDVEAAILRQPGIDGALVSVRSTPRGDARLTAYITSRTGAKPETETLRRTLRETLPGYMVPAAFIFLEAFPLTPHGKIDRQSLERIPFPRSQGEVRAATETEAILSRIWADALNLEDVERTDDFFDLGGDSLTAAVISAELNAVWGVGLELAAFAENPTIILMAQSIDRMRVAAEEETNPPVVRVSRKEPLPLSFSQEHIWRSSQTSKGSAHSIKAASVRIKGPLDLAAFRQGVNHIVIRHEMLRTTFQVADAEPLHFIHPAAPVDIPLIDLTESPDAEREAAHLLEQEAHVPFDLNRAPLFRLRLVRIRDGEHWLLRINHNIISDNRSWKIFFRELGVLYESFRRGEPPSLSEKMPFHYADFAVWQRRSLMPGGPRRKNLISWWKNALRDAPRPAPLPFRRAAIQENASPSEGWIGWEPEPEVSRRLDELGRKESATYFMVGLALFAAQIALETNQDAMILAGYSANRSRPEFQETFGSFVNRTIWRLTFRRNSTFREWLSRVRQTVIQTLAHADIPFDHLYDGLRREGVVPPQPNAAFHVADEMLPVRSGDIEITSLGFSKPTMPWGFTLFFDRWDKTRLCRATFDARIYEPSGVRSMIERYKQSMSAVAAQPDRPLLEVLRA